MSSRTEAPDPSVRDYADTSPAEAGEENESFPPCAKRGEVSRYTGRGVMGDTRYD